MARIFVSGCEIFSAVGVNSGSSDGALVGTNSTWVRDTSIKRSGLASAKVSNAASSPAYLNSNITGTTQVISIWIYFTAAPPNNCRVVGLYYGTGAYYQIAARLNTDRTVTIEYNNGSGYNSLGTSSALATSTWHNVQVRKNNAGGTAAGRVNGTTIGSISSISWVAAHTTCHLREAVSLSSAWDLWIDDWISDDTEIWIGNDKVYIAYPLSDSQVGTWTGGGGGTSNLYQAIDNFPPTGSDDDTGLIETADTSGDNSTDEYRANCGNYTNLGIGTSDTVKAHQWGCWHAEDANSGTKTGVFGGQTNPFGSSPSFNYGNNTGSAGSFPTNWFCSRFVADSQPVTKGNDIILYVRKTDTSSGIAQVAFLWVYVDVEPAAGNVLLDHVASGGYTLAGAAVITKDNVVVGSGGLVLAGAATVESIKDVIASGGYNLAGAADISDVRDFVPSGGYDLAGAADIVNVKDVVGSGGLTLAGSADIISIKDVIASGGLTLGGGADINFVFVHTPTGGIILAGDAITEYIPGGGGGSVLLDHIASGGYDLGGSATIEVVRDIIASGGYNLAGSATIETVKDVIASGGYNLAGSAVFQYARDYIATGGYDLGGAADVNLIHVFTPSGGIIFNSSHIVSYVRDVLASGGLVYSGNAITAYISANAATKLSITQLFNLSIRLDIKEISDSGSIAANSGDAGGTTVTFNKTFRDIRSIVATVNTTVQRTVIVDFTDAPNPTTFKVLVYDNAGVRQSETVYWIARGV